ncbi:MAG: Iron-binding protein IscA [Alphaproteobacteria bacterium MarineAlpha5_Bin5]|nr:MAG: Iron-binding protein IscA [Alphaproteobacteria bacterium MarineAlpha5_Bin5]|tara:strand:+ start:295 stop:630 length:336 start_codon:yes stop_codon:yes gene_type:complete
MSDIITITDNALEQIKKILVNASKDVKGIIVGLDKSGCSGYSYKLDFAKNETVNNFDIITKEGVKIFIDPKATMYLIGSEMDYSKDKLSSRFVFNNPNEKNSCGCGESFNF